MGIADTIVFFVEIVGTVAFALSGAVMQCSGEWIFLAFWFWGSALLWEAV